MSEENVTDVSCNKMRENVGAKGKFWFLVQKSDILFCLFSTTYCEYALSN